MHVGNVYDLDGCLQKQGIFGAYTVPTRKISGPGRAANLLILWRARRDSNSRPPGSKSSGHSPLYVWWFDEEIGKQGTANSNCCVIVGKSLMGENIARSKIIASSVFSDNAGLSTGFMRVIPTSLRGPRLADAYTGEASANPGAL